MNDRIVDSDFEYVSKVKHKNERLAWKRKYEKMQTLIKEKMEPLNEEALKIIEKKQLVLDELTPLRLQLVKECVHPKEFLVHMGTHITCKFCDSNLSLPSILEMENLEMIENESLGNENDD